jgi:RNA polymerase sigma-70 factor, ECF subfamily
MPDVASDDEVLSDVRAACKGDGLAYARIIRSYQQTVARRMKRFGRTQNDIEELVHEVFVETYFSLPKFRADAPFEHWLQRIATRVGYRYWKREHKRRRVDELPLQYAEHIAAVEENSGLDASEAAKVLTALLDQLSPRDRLVITLLHVEGHSVEETAQLTGWSSAMVKVQAYRARGKLRRLTETSQTKFKANLRTSP